MSSAWCEDPLLRSQLPPPIPEHPLFVLSREWMGHPRDRFPRPKTIPCPQRRRESGTEGPKRRETKESFEIRIQFFNTKCFFLRYICISLLLFKNKYVLRNISENCTRDKDVMLISFSPTIITDKQ